MYFSDTMEIDDKCLVCKRNFRKEKKKFRKVVDSDQIAEEYSEVFVIEVKCNDKICSLCMSKVHKVREKKKKGAKKTSVTQSQVSDSQHSSVTVSSSQSSVNDPTLVFSKSPEVQPPKELIELPIKRTLISHTRCCVCSEKKNNLNVVPDVARKQLFKEKKIFIPKGNRCFSNHLIKKRFYEEDLNKIKVFSNSCKLEVSEITNLLDQMVVDSNFEIHDKVCTLELS